MHPDFLAKKLGHTFPEAIRVIRKVYEDDSMSDDGQIKERKRESTESDDVKGHAHFMFSSIAKVLSTVNTPHKVAR